MQDDELSFMEDMIAGTELLMCSTCGEETLHAHDEVLDVSPVATELKMQCTCCQTTRTWTDWTPLHKRTQSN